MRAIFDNAGFVIPGEDVKVAGVKVGKISALDVTRDFKAVVVLDIEDPAYQDFRRDAECSIRPQSLIGEKLRRVRADAEARARRRGGAGAGDDRGRAGRGPAPAAGREHQQAGRPRPDQQHHARARARPAVDHPQRAGHRRRRPRQRPQRRDPPRQPGAQGDRQGPRDPRLPEPRRCSSWRWTATRSSPRWRASAATSPRRSPTRRRWRGRPPSAATSSSADIERLPRFLQELRPTMVRLGAFADEATPVLADLGDVAPDINRLLTRAGAVLARPASRRWTRSARRRRWASRR